MTCRHAPGDTNCGQTVGGVAWLANQGHDQESEERSRKLIEAERDKAQAEARRLSGVLSKFQRAAGTDEPPETPDSHNYEILEHSQVSQHLVLKVQYPNCAKCSYEGTKILVYEGVSVGDALLWRVIDPHFQDAKKARSKKEAPGPSARFPGSETGWNDALAYAADVLGHRQSTQRASTGKRCQNHRGPLQCDLDDGHRGPHHLEEK